MSKNIIFEYGKGSDFVFSTYEFFTPMEEDLKSSMVKTVGTVTINTRKLYRPKIKVEFSSNIHFIALDEGSSIQLEFILTRKSEGFDEITLGNRLYEITNIKSSLSQSFNFTFHDKDLTKGNHIYFIKTVPILVECSRIVITNCNVNALAHSEYEYKVTRKEKFVGFEEDLLKEEIRAMILKVQEDSSKIVKAIDEVKSLMGEQKKGK